jgi:small ligand-binding sensory domain FIST
MPAPLAQPSAASAVDRHADTRTAAWGVADRLGSDLAGSPSLAVVVASFHHAAALPEAVRIIRETTGASATLALTACGVLADSEEHHSGPTIAAIALGGPGIRARAFAFDHLDGPADVWSRQLVRSRLQPASPPRVVGLFGDPFSPGAANLARAVESAVPRGTPLTGGLISGGSQPGTNVLVADDRVLTGGTVGFVLEGAVEATPIVAHAGRAVGPLLVVTGTANGTITELSGRKASEVLDEVLGELPTVDRSRLGKRPLIGIAADAGKRLLGRGDYLLRPIATVDRGSGCLLVPGGVRRGSSVRFQVVDGETERQDLAMALDLAALDERPILGVIAASSAGRGPNLLGPDGHDAARLHARLGGPPLAGLVTAAELAPIAGAHHLAGLGLSAIALRPARDRWGPEARDAVRANADD